MYIYVYIIDVVTIKEGLFCEKLKKRQFYQMFIGG